MITINKIKLEDVAEARELLSHTWKVTYGKHYSVEEIEKVTNEWHSSKVLKIQAQDPNTYFAVAKNNKSKIVGLITVEKINNVTGFMRRIYVHPDQQGKNIGSKLMKSALDYFSSIEKLRVECEKRNNKACAFYFKKSFKIIEEKGNDVIFEKKIR